MIRKEAKKETASCEKCSCGSCCGGNCFSLILAILWCIAAIFACIYACKASQAAQKVYDLNVLSAWGIENLEKMNDLYKSQAYIDYATQQTDENISSFNQLYWNKETTSNSDENVEEDNTVEDTEENTEESTWPEFGSEWTLSADDIAKLKVNGLAYGPENAKITILEFADASCGYCRRQIGQDQTVDAVMAQYPNDVNVIFKNFPIFNETAAQAMACSEDYLSPENYHQYVIAVFQSDDATSVDSLANLAANYGADATTIANCVNNGDKADEVKSTMSEGQSFGINGTPSSVIINNESGQFSLIPGAYPVETFVETISSFLS